MVALPETQSHTTNSMAKVREARLKVQTSAKSSEISGAESIISAGAYPEAIR